MKTLAEAHPEPLVIGDRIRTDEHGRKYRNVFAGTRTVVGRLMETMPDSRQQPKSLAYRLREELNAI